MKQHLKQTIICSDIAFHSDVYYNKYIIESLEQRRRKMNQTFHMPAEEEIYYLSEFYKVFGDSTRIKILYVLLNQELCVNDIAQEINMTPSSVSHQLRILKQNRLVKFRRDGKTIYYSLADHHVKNILSQGLEHIEE